MGWVGERIVWRVPGIQLLGGLFNHLGFSGSCGSGEFSWGNWVGILGLCWLFVLSLQALKVRCIFESFLIYCWTWLGVLIHNLHFFHSPLFSFSRLLLASWRNELLWFWFDRQIIGFFNFLKDFFLELQSFTLLKHFVVDRRLLVGLVVGWLLNLDLISSRCYRRQRKIEVCDYFISHGCNLKNSK